MIIAVILTWHNVDDTVACIASLRESRTPVDRILLHDNGSTDGSAARLHTMYLNDPVVIFQRNSRNLGFARAVNRGIEKALAMGADHVLLLNNDTIVDPVCIGMLVDALEADPEAATAVPTIVYHSRPDVIWQGGGAFRKWRAGVVVPLKNRPLREAPSEVQQVGFQTGCAVLARRSALETAGLFDERFFFYAEDAEWSLRMQRAGFHLLFVPQALVSHKIGDISKDRSSPFVMYHRARGSILLARIAFPGRYVWYAALVQLLVYTPYRVVQVLRGGWNGRALGAWLAGLYDGVFHSERRRY